ncbi:Papain fold toxin 1, glutamine deamidase [Streptosporangium canum]|uniref:Papain fold toxin 1, glutamine deamidase n=2 Tax=Streptosporangium canum TaxID=324952 RepID=A0A1I3I8G3_9ACTN|nr:Papain fold toxin 1, glutamine deamidase [Streptosporangium canum]
MAALASGTRRMGEGDRVAQMFLPAGVYNPVVTADGQRWRDFELEAHGSVVVAAPREPERGQWRPLRLERCRPYGVAGGLARPDPQTQEDMVRAVPVTEQGIPRRFPDPRGMWIRLINGAGAAEDPFRATNAVDCALAVLCTWYGAPTVAAPRRPEYDRVGKPLLTGEAGGVARAERWLGQRFQYVGQGRHAYIPIAQALLAGGHGAAAIIINRWPAGGSHAWNAVNSGGEVIWIDAQRGHMAVEPPYESVTGVFCVVIDREGRRL